LKSAPGQPTGLLHHWLKNAHFFLPLSFNPKFENVPLALHFLILYEESLNKLLINYLCKKCPPTVECFATIHPWPTDRRQTTTSYHKLYHYLCMAGLCNHNVP